MPSNNTCPYPYTPAPACDQTYAEWFGGAYTAVWIVFAALAALELVLGSVQTFRLVRRFGFDPWGLQQLVTEMAVFNGLMLIIRIPDLFGYKDSMSLVEGVASGLQTTACITSLIAVAFSWFRIVLWGEEHFTLKLIVSWLQRVSMLLAWTVLPALSIAYGLLDAWAVQLVRFILLGLIELAWLCVALFFGLLIVRHTREANRLLALAPYTPSQSTDTAAPTSPPSNPSPTESSSVIEMKAVTLEAPPSASSSEGATPSRSRDRLAGSGALSTRSSTSSLRPEDVRPIQTHLYSFTLDLAVPKPMRRRAATKVPLTLHKRRAILIRRILKLIIVTCTLMVAVVGYQFYLASSLAKSRASSARAPSITTTSFIFDIVLVSIQWFFGMWPMYSFRSLVREKDSASERPTSTLIPTHHSDHAPASRGATSRRGVGSENDDDTSVTVEDDDSGADAGTP